MADWYKSVSNELEAFGASTLTELEPNQIMTVVNAVSRNIVSEMARALQANPSVIPPPRLIFDLGRDTPMQDGSIDAYLYSLPLSMFYVCIETGDATLTPLEWAQSRLNVLRTAMEAPSQVFTTFQWGGHDGAVDASSDEAFATMNTKVFGAKLGFDTGLVTRINSS